jgi:hypothetical protein
LVSLFFLTFLTLFNAAIKEKSSENALTLVRLYIMVHPETRALDKGICLAQQMCHIMILFQNGSSIKDEINQNVTFFVMF